MNASATGTTSGGAVASASSGRGVSAVDGGKCAPKASSPVSSGDTANQPVLVSVVIPTYNHAHFLLEAIESVLAQTWIAATKDGCDAAFEIVIIDDGSTDDTAERVEPYIDDKRVRYFHQANAGQSAARQRGWQAARGRYIAFLDDDDRFPPDKLQWQVELLEENPGAVMAYGDHARLLPSGRLEPDGKTGFPSGRVHRAFRRRNWIHSPGQTLIRRDALEAVGGFDRDVWGSDDWDLYIRLARRGAFLHRPRVSLHYRMHDSNASRQAIRHARGHLKVMRRHMGWNLPLIAVHLWLAGRYFAPNLQAQARRARQAGARGEARTAAAMALLFRPILLLRGHFWRDVAGRARAPRAPRDRRADAPSQREATSQPNAKGDVAPE